MKFWIGSFCLNVNITDRPALEAAIKDRLHRNQGFALATLNMDHLEKLRHDAGFQQAYAAQDLVVADGNPIVWMSRLAKSPVTLMPGSDLVLPLAQLCAREQAPVALIGSTPDSLDGAAAWLQQQVPDLQIPCRIAPPFGFDPNGAKAQAILKQAEASGARMVFLALGAPKQECFAALGRQVTPGLGFASIGAGLDFLSGDQTRAPKWVRAIAMEWLWRMLTNPRRLVSRYAKSFAILPGHLLRALRQARS